MNKFGIPRTKSHKFDSVIAEDWRYLSTNYVYCFVITDLQQK
jgi:hypothetical protein